MRIEGVIKPLKEYATHIRADVVFTQEGRRFIVVDDPAAFSDAAEKAKALADERRKQFSAVDADLASRQFGLNPDRAVIEHVAAPTRFNPNRREERRGRLIDLPGEPLLLDPVAYDYFRQAFGSSLVCEPVGGSPDIMAMAQENARLKAELERLKAAPAPAKK